MRTYKPRQGRKAATVVCSASAVVTLAFNLLSTGSAVFSMSYQVIARKYRPQRFSDVVGQEHVTQTLANAIAMGRIAHAYLFCGPRGTGKTTIARIFAKCLNCTNGPRVDFDDNDPKCREIAEGNSLDVIEIDGASNNGVEQVRQLREAVKYAPASSRFKIYIIDEVHMLSQGAFNALLKTLEEPPAHVKFMFATTDPEKIPPTVLSRCQRFDLRRIPVNLIVQHLQKIAKNEGIEIEPAALYAIARGSEGCMRDAESALDQLISFCGNKICESDVLSIFGLTSQAQLREIAEAIIESDSEKALRVFNELCNVGKDLSRFVSDLLSYFRNMLIYKVSKGDLALLEITEEQAEDLKKQCEQLSAEIITRIMDVFSECEINLRSAISRKILVELTLLKAIEARNSISTEALLKQLQKLRIESSAPQGVYQGEPEKNARSVYVSQASQPQVLCEAAYQHKPGETQSVDAGAGEETLSEPTTLQGLWDRVLSIVAKESIFLRGYLNEAKPISFDNGTLMIGFSASAEGNLNLADNDKNIKILQRALEACGYKDVRIKLKVVEGSEPAQPRQKIPPAQAAVSAQANVVKQKPQPSEQQPSEQPLRKSAQPKATAEKVVEQTINFEDFKNDPSIKEALERFRGRIYQIYKINNNNQG